MGAGDFAAPGGGVDVITLALEEDIGGGDVTVECFCGEGAWAKAAVVAREGGCLAGGGVALEVLRRVDPGLRARVLLADGAVFQRGDTVLEVEGAAGSILTAERTMLNFLQRLSGVATMARRFVDAVEGTGARILDTRKTTPGFRMLEKAAVAAAGAVNHRIGLHDMFLVKDNHLAVGGWRKVTAGMVAKAREAHPGARVELEADTLEQAVAFFAIPGVDVVMLDNMSLEDMREAVRLKPPGVLLEASGGVTLRTVRGIAETGVDFISVGAMTHSAPAIDFGLDFVVGG
jgi:nicotinate-nucleotide pyrophosphorylase (carboxylating)